MQVDGEGVALPGPSSGTEATTAVQRRLFFKKEIWENMSEWTRPKAEELS